MDYYVNVIRVVWFSTLFFWLALYLGIQWDRLLGGFLFRGQKKHLMERKEVSSNKFLRFMGVIWIEAFYIYPIRSLLVWFFVFLISVYFS